MWGERERDIEKDAVNNEKGESLGYAEMKERKETVIERYVDREIKFSLRERQREI